MWKSIIENDQSDLCRSPWWLVRKGRRAEARATLLRLTSANQPNFNPDETIAMIEHTNEMERLAKEGVTYRDCFKGVDLRRTIIVVGIWTVQTLGTHLSIHLPAYGSCIFSRASLHPPRYSKSTNFACG